MVVGRPGQQRCAAAARASAQQKPERCPMPQPRPRVTRIEDVSGLCQMSPGGEGAGGKTAQCSEPGPGLPCPRSLLSGPARMRHPRTNKLPLHPEYCTSNYTPFSVFLMRSAAPPAWMLANYGRTAERPEATEATPSSSSSVTSSFLSGAWPSPCTSLTIPTHAFWLGQVSLQACGSELQRTDSCPPESPSCRDQNQEHRWAENTEETRAVRPAQRDR